MIRKHGSSRVQKRSVFHLRGLTANNAVLIHAGSARRTFVISAQIKVGDQVQLSAVPDGLVHDLLDDEKREIWARIGKLGDVTEVDRYGYF